MTGPMKYLVYLFPVATLALIFYFFYYYWTAQRWAVRQKKPLEWVLLAKERSNKPPRFTLAGKCHPMGRRDALPLLLITAVYAVTAFAHLGSMQAPQSAQDFGSGEACVFTLEQDIYLTRLRYFPNLGTGAYNLEISSDGDHWSTLWPRTEGSGSTAYYWADAAGYAPSYALTQTYAQLFKWLEVEPENPQYVRYVRITGRADRGLLELGELALYDQNGALILVDPDAAPLEGGSACVRNPLFDEQDTIPGHSTYYDSTYFDEIYHPRTAYEHIRGVAPYEISHPPLGKLILGVGIRLFGMTPFGWRFMGTLFGVLMLPLLYLFLKNMFGRTAVASCGTILFAADFMHLTQTRIGTIDTYGVFFVLLMYYFMYRYLALPAGTPFRKCALPLFLSGLFWGIGAASKWTVIYGCIGLVVLYFLGLWMKIRDWPQSTGTSPGPWAVQILLFSVLCFAAIPAVIYTLSYLPYAQANGDTSLRGLVSVMWANQKYMLSYHSGITDTHAYSSRWYQWMLNIRPILYYLDTSVPGMKTAFGAFANPVVCWAGLLAVVSITVQMVRRRCGQALFILIGYLSQLVPWFFIGRITFEYHYFQSILFLVIALAYVFNDLAGQTDVRWKPAVYGMTGGAAALYALFYPVLAGITVPTWYSAVFLRWMPSWPF